ncbi:hypothetical protein [Microlunatus speluncae]|uniref:hypothetical protein n=1 Tax=Microlunatus speluncae TaxID=2594267 RepID=UPI0012666729|nr:hypothetical protein [Microlunatus speluncae]
MLVVAIVVGVNLLSPHRTETLSGSYSFDVTDPQLVAGYADVVVIGRVEAAHDTVSDPIIATKFQVTVVEVILGKAEPSETFLQYGGTSGKVTWVMEDQEPLTPGQTYVLAAGRGKHGYQVVGGPVAVQRLDTDNDITKATTTWRDHVANRKTPDFAR